MADSLKNKAAKGVAWSAVERFSSQGVQFVFNILIARILLPEDYGVVAMLNIFIAISNTFIDSGFGNALIRKINRTEEDYNTVFYFNIVVACIFCAILWTLAPAISRFYDIPALTKITRVLSFTLVINSFGSIQNTKLTIDINFKTRAIITTTCVTLMGIVGLVMARNGYGVWALVAQSVVNSIGRTALLWIFVHWIPKLMFSWKSFKEMISYGSKLLASALIDTLYGNIYNLVIGKVYSPSTLGEYNRGESFATFPSANLYGVIQNVSFPVLCSIQNDKEYLRESYRKFVCLSAYICFPLMLGLIALANPFITVILTDKWAGTIPLMQLICISLLFYPINAFNINMPNILGKSEYYLRLVIITRVIEVISLCITVPIGIRAMCYGKIVCTIISFILCTYYPQKLIGYGLRDQLKDFLPILANALFMAAIVVVSTRFLHSGLLKLTIGTVVGALIYIASSYILKFKEFNYILSLVANRRK